MILMVLNVAALVQSLAAGSMDGSLVPTLGEILDSGGQSVEFRLPTASVFAHWLP